MAKISEKFRRINRPIDDPVRRYEVAIEFGYLDPPRR
jgi:hypothetical protein